MIQALEEAANVKQIVQQFPCRLISSKTSREVYVAFVLATLLINVFSYAVAMARCALRGVKLQLTMEFTIEVHDGGTLRP